MEANIGRDISKFFYGGYSLENYTPISTVHMHSNIARLVVNGLVVAKLEKTVPQFEAKIVERHAVNKFTNTITFKAESSVQDVQMHYKDIQMIGKHYLVRSTKNKSVKRHYTISNCMQKD